MTVETEAISQALVSKVKAIGDVKDHIDLPEPHLGESLTDLHNRLLVVRSHQTTVAALVGDLVRLRAGVRKKRLDLQGALETAEAEAVTARRPKLTEDYSSAMEKNSTLKAATLNERFDLRSVEKLIEDVEAALAYARSVHAELGSQVQDVNTRLRILNSEATLG
jgi:hypothetical protein